MGGAKNIKLKTTFMPPNKQLRQFSGITTRLEYDYLGVYDLAKQLRVDSLKVIYLNFLGPMSEKLTN